ncbi:UBIQUITIN-LIKE SUPERFAMILY PROTEIN [Salix viminalis]|uniref:UBIQUITIN-LIKE SUPERFAMILY PROTEIN n=1 Tax=Salix viminalis TaxID=40686 RepID=A0A9Q0Z4J9_SALVM|nr:UBIQUITIN-LIKE SUPERFAMILY PROTEIN [Salix viminalis]KAJ6721200.1 UBIQUITIN-LIKE SUPERFAMILY PROTEIN [Salix viminalis]
MADFVEDLDSLFDYRRVQPITIPDDGDDDNDNDCHVKTPVPSPKKRKISKHTVEIVGGDREVSQVTNDDEDWLLPPPKDSSESPKQIDEDSTIKELRLRKQELKAFTSKECLFQPKRESDSVQVALESGAEESKPHHERAKIVVSIQDKDEVKQFRVYKDEKFERLFKRYADKAKLQIESLVFMFDGDKINLTATPDSLGMDDEDIIEVLAKKN